MVSSSKIFIYALCAGSCATFFACSFFILKLTLFPVNNMLVIYSTPKIKKTLDNCARSFTEKFGDSCIVLSADSTVLKEYLKENPASGILVSEEKTLFKGLAPDSVTTLHHPGMSSVNINASVLPSTLNDQAGKDFISFLENSSCWKTLTRIAPKSITTVNTHES